MDAIVIGQPRGGCLEMMARIITLCAQLSPRLAIPIHSLAILISPFSLLAWSLLFFLSSSPCFLSNLESIPMLLSP